MAMAHGGCRCPSSNELGAAQLTTTASGSGNGAWGVSMPELERARCRPAGEDGRQRQAMEPEAVAVAETTHEAVPLAKGPTTTCWA